MISGAPPARVKLWIVGEATATWGSLRKTSTFLAGTGAPLTALMMLELGGRTIMSAPMPLVRIFWPSIWPRKIAATEMIMTTSMAMAAAEMMERMGRWIRFAITSLFIGGRS